MNKPSKFLPIILNILTPYSGSFYAGSIERSLMIPFYLIIILSIILQNILYKYIHIKYENQIVFIIYLSLLIHSIYILKDIEKYKEQKIFALMICLTSLLSAVYSSFIAGKPVALNAPFPPYSAGDVFVYGDNPPQKGDLVIGLSQAGQTKLGILIAEPGDQLIAENDKIAIIREKSGDMLGYNRDCIILDKEKNITKSNRFSMITKINKMGHIQYYDNIETIRKVDRVFSGGAFFSKKADEETECRPHKINMEEIENYISHTRK